MKKLSGSMLAEGLACLLLAAFLFFLCASGGYMYYVTPRTVPYLYFSAGVLLLLGAHALARLFEKSHLRPYSHLAVLLVPLVLLTFSAGDMGLFDSLSAPREAALAPGEGGGAYAMTAPGYEGRALQGYDGEQRRLVIPQEEAYLWLVEIFEAPEAFEGFSVTTMGQVMKSDAYFSPNTFSPARQLMTCCAADLYPVGLVCQYPDTDSLEEGAWVLVTGELILLPFDVYLEPRIQVESVSPSLPPREPYLFLY
jgi:putative membrane protein